MSDVSPRDDDSIPLREFIERVANERWEAHTEVHQHEGKALEVATKELARRLEILNGAHEEAVRVQQTYVTRETYDTSQRDLVRKADEVRQAQNAYVSRELFDSYLKDAAGKHDQLLSQLSVVYNDISSMKGRTAAYTVAIGVFFTIVTVTVAILGRVLQ